MHSRKRQLLGAVVTVTGALFILSVPWLGLTGILLAGITFGFGLPAVFGRQHDASGEKR